MGIRYLFSKALKICSSLSEHERDIVANRCLQIQDCQKKLLSSAQKAMHRCINICQGLCCRNLDLDNIFSLWDFIFILTLMPEYEHDIQKCLDRSALQYPAPCPFLKDNRGPCIFPDGVRAQICAITFCSEDKELKNPVQSVNLNFYKLCWTIQYLRIRHMVLAAVPYLPRPRDSDQH